jgi:hypothetical protein
MGSALASAQEASELAPDSAPVAADLALALLGNGRRNEAAAEATRATDLDGKDGRVLEVRALVALAQERWIDAEAAARAAMRTRGSNAVVVRNNLALALLAQGKPADGRGMLRSVQEASLHTEYAGVVHRNLRKLGANRSRMWTPMFFGRVAQVQAMVLMGFMIVFIAVRALWILLVPLTPIALGLIVRGMLRGTYDDRQTFTALPAFARVTVRAPVVDFQ